MVFGEIMPVSTSNNRKRRRGLFAPQKNAKIRMGYYFSVIISIIAIISCICFKYYHAKHNEIYFYSKDWEKNLCVPTVIKNEALTVAILDTGIDFSNPYLSKSLKIDLDISPEVISDKIHGTAVASVIAADGSKFKGMLPNFNVISIKIGNQDGWSLNDFLEGLKFAISLQPTVINISGGFQKDSMELRTMIQQAVEKNIIIVAAAGNSARDYCDYPAAYPGVISVGAIDRNFNVASESNYGAYVDVYAPGEDILTVIPNSQNAGLTRFSGTSIATPLVSSLAILIKYNNPSLTNKQIKEVIRESADMHTVKQGEIKVVNFNKILNL
jgi:subtilisin family serine protease